MMERSI